MSTAALPLVWLVLAAGNLLLLEMLAPGFDGLLVGAIGALVVSFMSAVVPIDPCMAVDSGLPWQPARWRNVDAALVEETGPHPERFHDHEAGAAVLSPFDSHGEGRGRWHGQSWAAIVLGR